MRRYPDEIGLFHRRSCRTLARALDVLTRVLLTHEQWWSIKGLILTFCVSDVVACNSALREHLGNLLENVSSDRATVDADVAIQPQLNGVEPASLGEMRPAAL